MKFSSFLPQDTRSTEFASALALIMFGFFCGIHETFHFNTDSLLRYHVEEFWTIVTMAMGVLQLFSVALYPKTELLRVLLSWVNGTFWIWLSLSPVHYYFSPSDFGTFFLGVVNLYAFCINALLLRKTWEN